MLMAPPWRSLFAIAASGSVTVTVRVNIIGSFNKIRKMERHQPRRSLPGSSSRAHQACENCRRKKSRCSGGKPKCSLCARLSQQCVYADELEITQHRVVQSRHRDSRLRASPQPLHRHGSTPFRDQRRFEAIESRLEDITRALVTSRSPNGQAGLSSDVDELLGGTDRIRAIGTQPVQSTELPMPDFTTTDNIDLSILESTAKDGVSLYFERFQHQPCPLLSHLKGDGARKVPPDIVLYPMVALVSMTSKHRLSSDMEQLSCLSQRLAERSWSLLSEAYAECRTDESYLEGLCLMAQRDFAVGNTLRARSQIAFGLRIAQISGLFIPRSRFRHDHPQDNRHAEIVWSLFLLDRMYLSLEIPSTSTPLASFTNLAFGNTGPEAGKTVSPLRCTMNNSSIIANIVDHMGVWEAVVADLSETNIDAVDSWKADSARTKITSRLLELEIGTRPHSYTSVGSLSRLRTEPHLEPYFRAWLFFQFLHSAIHCCLNHPFLIFIKMRHLQDQVPFTFLQECYRYSKVFADWTHRTVGEMEDAGLNLHEPFVGFLVAIAASIHLEHTLNANPTVAAAARSKFRRCMVFVQRLAQEWPNLRQTVSVMSELESRLQTRGTMHYVQDDFDGAQPQSGSRHVSLSEDDISLMWHLFDYDKVSNKQQDVQAGASDASNTWAVASHTEQSGTGAYRMPETPDILGDNITVPQNHDDGVHGDNTVGSGWEDITLGLEADANDWSLFGAPWMGYFPSV
ncbi:hypothetical protein Q7P37_007867 [Cladosporium fusiforme]